MIAMLGAGYGLISNRGKSLTAISFLALIALCPADWSPLALILALDLTISSPFSWLRRLSASRGRTRSHAPFLRSKRAGNRARYSCQMLAIRGIPDDEA
jgi:hypothetical protein